MTRKYAETLTAKFGEAVSLDKWSTVTYGLSKTQSLQICGTRMLLTVPIQPP